MDTNDARPIARQWTELYDTLTPAERQAARGYVLTQRYPRHRVFPRKYSLRNAIIIGADPDPAGAAAFRRSPLAQLLGRAANLVLLLFGMSGVFCVVLHAAIIGVLMIPLPYVAHPFAAASLLGSWAALVVYIGSQFAYVTKESARKLVWA